MKRREFIFAVGMTASAGLATRSGRAALQNGPYQMINLIDSPAHQTVVEKVRLRHLSYFKETQYNLSADYVPRLTRMQQEVGGEPKDLEERLYQMFRENVGLNEK